MHASWKANFLCVLLHKVITVKNAPANGVCNNESSEAILRSERKFWTLLYFNICLSYQLCVHSIMYAIHAKSSALTYIQMFHWDYTIDGRHGMPNNLITLIIMIVYEEYLLLSSQGRHWILEGGPDFSHEGYKILRIKISYLMMFYLLKRLFSITFLGPSHLSWVGDGQSPKETKS